MKTIKATTLLQLNGIYHISLGNGYKLQFHNRQAAKQFQSKTAKYLTATSVQVNEFYLQCYEDFRRCLFYTDKQSRWNTQIEFLQQNFNSTTHLLEYAYRMASGINGNTRPLANLIACCDNLITICLCLKKFYAAKSATVDVYRYTALLQQIQQTKNILAHYGSEYAIDFSTHIKTENNVKQQRKSN